MYLLENQAPLRILEILVYLRYNTPREVFIKEIGKYSFKMFFNYDKGIMEAASALGSDVVHLLEIFRVIVRGQDHGGKYISSYNVNRLLSCMEKGCCKGDGEEMIPGSSIMVAGEINSTMLCLLPIVSLMEKGKVMEIP